MSFLDVAGMVKNFGETTAVAGADLEVARGEVLALLGPSGCGKTTLLRLIAGFEAPDAGTLTLDGRTLVDARTFEAPERRRIGMVFQDFALFPHMDVAGNIAFGLPKGVDRKRRVGELLDLVGLPHLGGRFPHELSGGQQQRVAIARALAAEPALMLLDEPFSNLDPSIRQRVRAEVRALMDQVGITVVFVTHDQEEALSVAGQVAVMMAGRVLQVGTPAEIYAQPADRAVAEFVGEAAFLPGDVSGGKAHCELGTLEAVGSILGAADIMVRAEDIVLADGGIAAEVLSVEYFGHDMLALLRLPSGHTARARWKTDRIATPGSRVEVRAVGRARAFPRSAPGTADA